MTLDPVPLVLAALAAGAFTLSWRMAARGPVASDEETRVLELVQRRIRTAFRPYIYIAATLIGGGLLALIVFEPEEWVRAIGALFTGIVIVIGWLATSTATELRNTLNDRRAEDQREKVRIDTLYALRTEITAYLDKLDSVDIIADGKSAVEEIIDGAKAETPYRPFLTRDSEPIIFQALSEQVVALGPDTTRQVVRFYAEYSDLQALIVQFNAPPAMAVAGERLARLYWLVVKRQATALYWALRAVVAINRALPSKNPTAIPRTGNNIAFTHDGLPQDELRFPEVEENS
ncbi:MAG: hypothetical protein AAFN09_06385 [Pseudomonadota bacterium]